MPNMYLVACKHLDEYSSELQLNEHPQHSDDDEAVAANKMMRLRLMVVLVVLLLLPLLLQMMRTKTKILMMRWNQNKDLTKGTSNVYGYWILWSR